MRTLLFAASLTAALGAATPAALASPVDPAPITLADADVDADAARYADAEQQHPQAADFTGGSTVIVIGSTTALVLAILLVLLLI